MDNLTARYGGPILISAALILAATSGCKSVNQPTSADDSDLAANRRSAKSKPKTCVAVRGNGGLIYAHFGALAKISEDFGPLYAMAGGSSGSITTFFYESIIGGPWVRNRSGELDDESGAKISLMFKSLLGVTDIGAESELGSVIPAALELAEIGKSLAGNGAGDPKKAINRLLELLGKGTSLNPIQIWKDFKYARYTLEGFVEPDFAKAIQDAVRFPNIVKALVTANPEAITKHGRMNEVMAAISALRDLDGSDARVFFRLAMVSFSRLARKLSRVAEFYAGYESAGTDWGRAMEKFVQNCSRVSVGKTWHETPSSCQTQFKDAFRLYGSLRKKPQNQTLRKPRYMDRFGRLTKDFIPIIPIAYVDKRSNLNRILQAGKKAYLQNPNKRIPADVFGPRLTSKYFERELRFGYWVPNYPQLIKKLRRAATRSDRRGALAVKKRDLLLDRVWLQALATSPGEPSLAPIAPFPGDSTKISLGGWSDLHPVQILRDTGCDDVIYLTRIGPHNKFGMAMSRMMGMNDRQYDQLYNLESRNSAFTQALFESSMVYCTNWDSWSFGSIDKDFFAHGFNNAYYKSKMEVGRDKNLYNRLSRLNPGRVSRNLNEEGCSPGHSLRR